MYRGFRARDFLHTARQRRIKAERTAAAYQLSSTLMLSVIEDDDRNRNRTRWSNEGEQYQLPLEQHAGVVIVKTAKAFLAKERV